MCLRNANQQNVRCFLMVLFSQIYYSKNQRFTLLDRWKIFLRRFDKGAAIIHSVKTMAILDENFVFRRHVGKAPRIPNSPKKNRLALQKSVRNDTELHIPRAYLWKKGNAMVRGVYTGMPLLVINNEACFDNHLQPKRWTGKETVAQISEVDPYTGRVGRIVAILRQDEKSLRLYTYFPSFQGQEETFKDKDFVQNCLYHYGEFFQGRTGYRKHIFGRVVGETKDGQARLKSICEAMTPSISLNPLKRFSYMCNNDLNIELHDPHSGDVLFSREDHHHCTGTKHAGRCLPFLHYGCLGKSVWRRNVNL